MSSTEHGVPENIMAEIRKAANELYDETSDDYEIMIEEETEAYLELQTFEASGVEAEIVQEIRKAAEEKYPKGYFEQLEYVRKTAYGYKYVQEARKRIDPIKQLLISMERIIGGECCNANIQNYGPYGEYVGEGRSFSYPVTFSKKKADDKVWTVSSDIEAEVLMTGRYKFGANQPNIFRGLERVLDFLQKEHGLCLDSGKNGAE